MTHLFKNICEGLLGIWSLRIITSSTGSLPRTAAKHAHELAEEIG
jgi:hypothetical protein